MEWLEGEDLETRNGTGDRSGFQETIELAQALTAGLSCAHERGFIHRDLKPSNLFLPSSDVKRAKVLDFGLARTASHADAITKTGTIMGTLEYMAPEQAVDAKRVDSRADVFSLGVVLYLRADRGLAVSRRRHARGARRVVSREVPPVSAHREGVPARFEAIIARMMRKEAGKRFRDAGQVASALTDLTFETTAALPRARSPRRVSPARTTLRLRVPSPPPSPRPRTAVLAAPPAPPSSPAPSSSSPPSTSRPPRAPSASSPRCWAAGGLMLVLTAGLRGVVAPVHPANALAPRCSCGRRTKADGRRNPDAPHRRAPPRAPSRRLIGAERRRIDAAHSNSGGAPPAHRSRCRRLGGERQRHDAIAWRGDNYYPGRAKLFAHTVRTTPLYDEHQPW